MTIPKRKAPFVPVVPAKLPAFHLRSQSRNPRLRFFYLLLTALSVYLDFSPTPPTQPATQPTGGSSSCNSLSSPAHPLDLWPKIPIQSPSLFPAASCIRSSINKVALNQAFDLVCAASCMQTVTGEIVCFNDSRDREPIFIFFFFFCFCFYFYFYFCFCFCFCFCLCICICFSLSLYLSLPSLFLTFRDNI